MSTQSRLVLFGTHLVAIAVGELCPEDEEDRQDDEALVALGAHIARE